MNRREEIISTLLDRYHELVDPSQPRDGSGDGVALPLMPATYTPTVREIERLIGDMRLQAVKFGRVAYWQPRNEFPVYLGDSTPGSFGIQAMLRAMRAHEVVKSTGLGVIRHHLVGWYLRAETSTKLQPVTAKRNGRVVTLLDGDRRPVTRPVISVRRSPNAVEALALVGVAWMADHWELASEPRIPEQLRVPGEHYAGEYHGLESS